MGTLKELGIRRGWRARDWGWGAMDEQQFGPIRLLSVFERDAQEAWYLVTSLEFEVPAEVVRLYKRRMWTEALFRDLKNRDWGLGLDHVRLSTADRHDRHFAILALTYVLLCAFGAAAETFDIARQTESQHKRRPRDEFGQDRKLLRAIIPLFAQTSLCSVTGFTYLKVGSTESP